MNTWLQSAPWCTGNTDALVGDGQVAKDGKHPFKVGGVETGLGLWEFMGDTLFVSDGTGFGIAVNPDTRNEKKNAVADGVTPTAACMPAADGTCSTSSSSTAHLGKGARRLGDDRCR